MEVLQDSGGVMEESRRWRSAAAMSRLQCGRSWQEFARSWPEIDADNDGEYRDARNWSGASPARTLQNLPLSRFSNHPSFFLFRYSTPARSPMVRTHGRHNQWPCPRPGTLTSLSQMRTPYPDMKPLKTRRGSAAVHRGVGATLAVGEQDDDQQQAGGHGPTKHRRPYPSLS
jgi:hypothetical protein